MRRKVLLGALLAAFLAVLAMSGTASAGKPIGGCPDSFTLIRANVDPVVDINGDGWICTKKLAPDYNDIDNNTPN
jgi:hypothetical protein